jgi:hypothetical protein
MFCASALGLSSLRPGASYLTPPQAEVACVFAALSPEPSAVLVSSCPVGHGGLSFLTSLCEVAPDVLRLAGRRWLERCL